jgi:methylmalonyl-CoA mutase
MNNFFSEFEAVSRAAWQKQVEKVLKGASVDTLNWQVDADLSLQPLYRKEEVSANAVTPPAANNSWQIVEHFDFVAAEVPQINIKMLNALSGGCQEIVMKVASTDSIGLVAASFSGVWTDMVRISWQLEDISTARKLLPILDAWASSGHISIQNAEISDIYELACSLQEQKLNYTCCTVCSTKNETYAQNLTDLLAQAAEWLSFCRQKLRTIDWAVGFLQVAISVGDFYFVEIAKIRAFKRLWLALLRYFDADAPTLPRLLAQTDSKNNLNNFSDFSLLAATSQALSASIAGVDALYILPPTGWENITDDTARRLARNIHHLLQEESHLDAVADPAAGAYYIEAATQNLTSAAWEALTME